MVTLSLSLVERTKRAIAEFDVILDSFLDMEQRARIASRAPTDTSLIYLII
jgi:hypothetical protein